MRGLRPLPTKRIVASTRSTSPTLIPASSDRRMPVSSSRRRIARSFRSSNEGPSQVARSRLRASSDRRLEAPQGRGSHPCHWGDIDLALFYGPPPELLKRPELHRQGRRAMAARTLDKEGFEVPARDQGYLPWKLSGFHGLSIATSQTLEAVPWTKTSVRLPRSLIGGACSVTTEHLTASPPRDPHQI